MYFTSYHTYHHRELSYMSV